MTENVWVLAFHWYMGMDGSGMHIFGIYSSQALAEENRELFLNQQELADEEYNREWVTVEEYSLNSYNGVTGL